MDTHKKIAAEIWPFLTVFGGDVTSRFEYLVQIKAECNKEVTSK